MLVLFQELRISNSWVDHEHFCGRIFSEVLPKENFHYPICGLRTNHKLVPVLGISSRDYDFKPCVRGTRGSPFCPVDEREGEGRGGTGRNHGGLVVMVSFSDCVSSLILQMCFCLYPFRIIGAEEGHRT